MVVIKPLTGINLETVYEAFSGAFSDYVVPVKLSYSRFESMVQRRGADLKMSFGAFDADKLVGFTLNAVGDWGGRRTAYDVGTGVVPDFRKKGLAARIFEESLPVLRGHGVAQYLLEVIRTNTTAFDLYRKFGFRVAREFDSYISPRETLSIDQKQPANQQGKTYVIKEVATPDWNLFGAFRDFEPSWQNSVDAIRRNIHAFDIFGVFMGGTPVGYGIVERATGDIPQLAVRSGHRRKGLGTALFRCLVEAAESPEIRCINIDAGDISFRKFAGSVHMAPGAGQYEMRLALS